MKAFVSKGTTRLISSKCSSACQSSSFSEIASWAINKSGRGIVIPLRRRVYPSRAAPSHASLVMGISSKASKLLESLFVPCAHQKLRLHHPTSEDPLCQKSALHLSLDFFISLESEIANLEGGIQKHALLPRLAYSFGFAVSRHEESSSGVQVTRPDPANSLSSAKRYCLTSARRASSITSLLRFFPVSRIASLKSPGSTDTVNLSMVHLHRRSWYTGQWCTTKH